jgi:hypothetical protein
VWQTKEVVTQSHQHSHKDLILIYAHTSLGREPRIVDDATGQWLDAWVVPSNRMGGVVLYLFLCAVEDVGGMSSQ